MASKNKYDFTSKPLHCSYMSVGYFIQTFLDIDIAQDPEDIPSIYDLVKAE